MLTHYMWKGNRSNSRIPTEICQSQEHLNKTKHIFKAANSFGFSFSITSCINDEKKPLFHSLNQIL